MRMLTRWGRVAAVAAAVLFGAVAVATAQTGTVTDSRDGKTYKTVTVFTTTWMAENLNYQTSSGSWCYDNNSANCAKYGRLYDFNTAKTACPAGWELPSLKEMNLFLRRYWEEIEVPMVPIDDDLFILVGSGKILKAKNGWEGPNGTDNIGFSGLPGGQRKPDGSFKSIGSAGNWWLGHEFGDNDAAVLTLSSRTGDDAGIGTDSKRYGYSVRCVKVYNKPAQQGSGGSGGGAGTFTDSRDGKTYRAVKIGGQTWMGENLNYQTASGSWCYKNDNSNCGKYGRLYDWNTAKTSCPAGFHLPSRQEWDNLVTSAGGVSAAGKKLKARSGWNNNGNGTDDFGFSALPGGTRGAGGTFGTAGYYGFWWTATENGAGYAYLRDMSYDNDRVDEGNDGKSLGISVRCVQD